MVNLKSKFSVLPIDSFKLNKNTFEKIIKNPNREGVCLG